MTAVAIATGPAGRWSGLARRITSRYPAYERAVTSPIATPARGSAPYACAPTTPEISTTPASMTGRATNTSRRGRSPSSSQAASATITTCRLPMTVASPAPIRSTTTVERDQVAR